MLMRHGPDIKWLEVLHVKCQCQITSHNPSSGPYPQCGSLFLNRSQPSDKENYSLTDRPTDTADFIICPMQCYSNGTDNNCLCNRRWGGFVYVLQMFFSVFFCFFSIRHKNTRQPFSGTAEWIFMKLLPNDSGENVVSNVVPKWGLGPQLIFGG